MSFHTSRRFTRSVPAACGLLVAALAAPAPSCRRGEEGPELGDSVLVVACREPATLDPAFLVGRNETGVVTSLLEGLFRPAADGGLPEPALALSWECAGDDLRCVFHLDPSASWTDGKPVTAGDLVWSWRRVAAAETGSPGAETLHVIRGMAACTAGQGCNPGLRAVDDHTLEVELEYPIPNIPYTFAHARFSPVPRHVVEDLGEAWTEPERFVGNGDYLPVAWRRGVSMTLKAVDGRHAGPRSVELRFTESEDTAFRWFEAGEVDVVEGLVPLDRVPALLRDRPGVVSEAPAAGVFYLAPNLGRPPMDAAALRRALSLALDRELLVETVLGTGQEPAVSLVPGVVARLSGYVPPAECSGRDLAAARRALAGAGHPGGRGLPPVELLYNQSATLTRIMEFIQQDLADAAGIRTTLRGLEWQAFLEIVRGGGFDLARFGLSGEPDPMDFLGALASDAPNNIGGFRSAEYDALLEEARRTAAPERRNVLLARAEAILCREAVVIPVYHASSVVLVGPRVRGYVANHSGLHPLRDVRLGP